jgi:hypothetical protein
MKLHRHPKTTAECRAEGDANDQGVKVRAKRSYRRLPNNYDDINFARRSRHDRHKDHRR